MATKASLIATVRATPYITNSVTSVLAAIDKNPAGERHHGRVCFVFADFRLLKFRLQSEMKVDPPLSPDLRWFTGSDIFPSFVDRSKYFVALAGVAPLTAQHEIRPIAL